MLSRSDSDRENELGEVVGTVASVSLEASGAECVFVDGDIFRRVYSLGLLYALG